MKTGKFLLGVVVAAPIAAAGIALALAGVGGAGDLQQGPPKGNYALGQARTFSDFPLLNPGASVDGAPLTAVLRRNSVTSYVPTNFVSFIYGDCVALSDSGCAPPAEVQVWPACVRHLALYDTSKPETPTPETTSVRGVPAAFFDDGQRLEIHTGRSLVVIFADSRESTLGIAKALRGVNVAIPPEIALPPPAAGAVEGKLSC
jgi:hypothetical protein